MSEDEDEKPSKIQRLRKDIDSFADRFIGIDLEGLVFFAVLFVVFFVPAIIAVWLARRPWGWVGLVIVAAAAAAIIHAYYPYLLGFSPRIFLLLSVASCCLFATWATVAIGLGAFGTHLEFPRWDWSELTPLRKIGRVLLTLAGTALFISPFVLIAWHFLQG